MAATPSFTERLIDIIKPTSYQAWITLAGSAVVIIIIQFQNLLAAIGVTKQALSISGNDIHQTLTPFLSSPITAQAALVIFWAAVGLIAYLACWSVYNLMIEARNEVTLTTEYTNKVSDLSYLATLGLKALSGIGLGFFIFSLWPGLPYWVNLAGQAITHPGLSTMGSALLGIIGLAVQLYLILVFIQLTFTPWYRVEPFTDQ